MSQKVSEASEMCTTNNTLVCSIGEQEYYSFEIDCLQILLLMIYWLFRVSIRICWRFERKCYIYIIVKENMNCIRLDFLLDVPVEYLLKTWQQNIRFIGCFKMLIFQLLFAFHFYCYFLYFNIIYLTLPTPTVTFEVDTVILLPNMRYISLSSAVPILAMFVQLKKINNQFN